MPKVRGNQNFSRNLSAIFFSAHKFSQEAMRPRERLSWLVSKNKSYLSFIFLIAAIKITIYVKQTSAGEKFGNLCENHNKTFFLKRRSFFVGHRVSTGWKYLFSLFCKQFELEILSMHSICFEIYLNFPDSCFKVCLCPSSNYVKTAWVEWFFHRASGKTSQLSLSMSARRRGTKERGASARARWKKCYTKKARRKQQRISRIGRVIQFRVSSSLSSLRFFR